MGSLSETWRYFPNLVPAYPLTKRLEENPLGDLAVKKKIFFNFYDEFV